MEIVPELVTFGAANLAATHQPWATLEPAVPATLGLPEHAPYDRILVSAQPPELPDELVDQLAEGGRLVVPVAGTMLLVQRTASGVEITRHGSYRFVPLRRPLR